MGVPKIKPILDIHLFSGDWTVNSSRVSQNLSFRGIASSPQSFCRYSFLANDAKLEDEEIPIVVCL